MSLDVTKQRQTEDELRESRDRLQGLFDNALDAIFLLDVDGACVDVNPAACGLGGYTRAELLGAHMWKLTDLAEETSRVLWQTFLDNGSMQDELEIRRKDDVVLQAEFRAVANILPGVHLAILRDVTHSRQLEQELAYRALHDTFTTLPNRALFHDRLDHALKLAARDGSVVGVALIDLDDFKQINDSLGHDAGDTLLEEVADRLRRNLRESDTAGRFGGDEFTILLEGLRASPDAVEVVERIIGSCRHPFTINGREVSVTVSVGLTTSNGNSEPEAMIREADAAMYVAKSSGKNRYALFEAQMHVMARRRLELRADLENALNTDALELHYQPILDLASGAVTGAEALLRWEHPELGAVPPGEFVPAAEQSGLIVPLGWWVLERACRQLATWQKRWPHLVMCVNVSARQLYEGDFLDRLTEVLSRHRVEPGSLCLELTERALIEADSVQDLLTAVRRTACGSRLTTSASATRPLPTCDASRSTRSKSTGRGYFATTAKPLVSGGFRRLSRLESGAKPGVIGGAG